MISSMAAISSSSSATVRVEKATSEFLIGPDWTLNIDICDTINSNQMMAKDVVKAVKKRLQHKNPKIQLLALTLLETMVKNCGDYVHFQIAERNILQEMVKIVKKKTDMHVRDKILVLIASWHEAFGGRGGRYPQYFMAFEDLRRSGVEFPLRPPDAAPIFTPPVTNTISKQPQPGYGMPSSSSTRLDEAMSAEENISLSSLDSMSDVLDLLTDMLQAVDPNNRSALKDEVIVDLVEQSRSNQKKLMHLLTTTGDEELLAKGLELNDSLQIVLAKHDSIASGSPLPHDVRNITPGASEKHDSNPASAEVGVNNAASTAGPSVLVLPVQMDPAEEDEEEDDFALLARRHSKTRVDASNNSSTVKSDVAPPEAPLSPAMSNALVPIDAPASFRSKDQDIIDLLSITLSTPTPTEQTSPAPTSPMHTPGPIPSTTFPSETYAPAFNNYVAPWAQPQLSSQPEHPPFAHSPPPPQPGVKPQHQSQYQYATQQALNTSHPQPQFPQYNSMYPPPPWAATPGYFNSQAPAYPYSTSRPVSLSNPRPNFQYESINGETQAISSPQSAAAANVGLGPRPFIPTYRLFEDLNVFGNADGRFKATGNASPGFSGSNNQSMVGGRK